jgi:hypothetical protein
MTGSFVIDPLIRWRVVPDPWRDGVLARRVPLWLQRVHESRACERGDGCVVGEFVLACQWSIVPY